MHKSCVVQRLVLIPIMLLLLSCTDAEPGDSNSPEEKPTPDTESESKVATNSLSDAEKRSESLKSNHPVILSYFWPVVGEQANPRTFTMQTPNYIDLLRSESHGSKETRDYWTSQGKLQLNRVNPFRRSEKADYLREDLRDNLDSAAGISVDEIDFDHWKPERYEIIAHELEVARQNSPEKLFFVWDVSTWNEKTAPTLRRIAATADAIALETYISLAGAKKNGFKRFKTKLNEVLTYAPEAESKIVLGIGAFRKMRNNDTGNLSEHLIQQVRFIACEPEFENILGIGIYAPLYLTIAEQSALDTAIMQYLIPSPADRPCT